MANRAHYTPGQEREYRIGERQRRYKAESERQKDVFQRGEAQSVQPGDFMSPNPLTKAKHHRK